MLSNDPAGTPQQSSSHSRAKAVAVKVPVMDAGAPLEMAPGGSGTINDPPASDTKPPGVTCDLGYLNCLS